MASAAAHLQQARENRALARHLLTLDSEDLRPAALRWAVVVAFYTSVHCMDAYLAGRGFTPSSHRSRAAMMSNAGIPDAEYTAHEQLQQLSLHARYLLRSFTSEYVQSVVMDGYLRTVTAFVRLED